MSRKESPMRAQKLEIRKDKFKKTMLGSAEKRGVLMSIVVYVLLVTNAFIYL